MKNTILILLSLLSLNSCSNRYYLTYQTKQKLVDMGVDFKKIQFYNSEQIILVRDINKEDIKISSGKIKYENGRYIEEIIIKQNTPGVFVEKNDKEVIMVSFDASDTLYLPFMKIRNQNLSESEDIYELKPFEKKRNNLNQEVGYVRYGGNKYLIVQGIYSRLAIDKSMLFKESRKTTVVKGRKIN